MRDQIFSLEVDGIPPTINSSYSNSRLHLRRFLSADAKSFKNFVHLNVLEKRILVRFKEEFNYKKKIGHRFELVVSVCQNWILKSGEDKKQDISNRLKIAEDAICEALEIDDSKFSKVSIEKIQSKKDKKTLFKIYTYID